MISVLHRDRHHLSLAAVRRIYWLSASQSLVILLCRGVLSPVLQDLILTVRSLERDMAVHLTAIYVPFRPPPSHLLGLSIRLPFSTDEWAVRRSDLATVFAALRFCRIWIVLPLISILFVRIFSPFSPVLALWVLIILPSLSP